LVTVLSTRRALFALAAIVSALGATTNAGAAPVARATVSTWCNPFVTSSFSSVNRITGTASYARGAADREPSGWRATSIDEAPATHKKFNASIPVYFHVFTDGATGNLTSQQISDQINVLNADYGGFEGGFATGFSFKLAGVERIDNANWFNNLTPGSSVEREAKAATHTGDASTLNIWTTNGPGYLGFATFPSWYKRSPQLDGIVIDYNSLEGGAYGTKFSLAKTATHEAGHWLGLLHTFQGACSAKGDYVDDTPFEATPTSGCPEGKDTCSDPGLDPIHNYMDYSYDSCYSQFTGGQGQRMRDQWLFFRADGGTSVGQ
jgi:hypothetical protein